MGALKKTFKEIIAEGGSVRNPTEGKKNRQDLILVRTCRVLYWRTGGLPPNLVNGMTETVDND
jgi:hypothetical protein